MGVALLFSGQGSQYVGMGCSDRFGDVVADTWREADEALGEHLSRRVAEGPADALTLTTNAQPAILTTSIAMYRAMLLERPDLTPSFAAGHSLGEYSALVAAGAMEFADAVRLVRLRGEAMQEAVPAGVGGMAAFSGLDVEGLQSLAQEIGSGVLELAAENSPSQLVVAGHIRALEEMIDRAPNHGVRRSTMLNVSAPFHCSMLRPAQERLAEALEKVELKTPDFPVYQNVDGRVSTSPDEIREKLVRQVSAPVLWVRCLESMLDAGASRFIEVGPGRALTGMVKKLNRRLDARFVDRAGGLASL